ncbi:eCIS core domain-containing protein [Streptomyces pactum]|uniref:eCIS core domain-containing protein n=1 Tax=Streptomyces pactum TaxID=68249 RepID=UPI0036F54AF1
MHGHEHGNESDHHPDHRHEHTEEPAPSRETEAPGAAELPHLFKAAAGGRTDVIGRSGLGTLQRAVGNSAVGSLLRRETVQREPGEEEQTAPRSSVHDVIASGGRSLDPDTRTDMESRLGADFSDVRVHTGSAAHESAREVGARAYTVGSNVVFQRDAYDPGSHEGRTTLAHELTHVIQQRSGPVDGTEAPGGIRVSDPSDRFEQEAAANAERVMAGPAPDSAPAPAPAAAPAAAAPVQRQESEGEDEQPADVQGLFVQRAAEQAAPEEEEEAPPPS